MIETTCLKNDVEKLIKSLDLSYEHIAAGVGVSSMTVRRWHKEGVKPKSRVVIKSFENYKKTLIEN